MKHPLSERHHPGENITRRIPGADLALMLCLLIAATTVTAQTEGNTNSLTTDATTGNSQPVAAPMEVNAAVAPDKQEKGINNKPGSNGKNKRTASVPESTSEGSPAEPAQQQPDNGRSNKLTTAIERFTPTEEIKVDNAVPFPVDI